MRVAGRRPACVGFPVGGGRMQPVKLARDPHPGFIEMGHACVPDGARNLRDGGGPDLQPRSGSS